MDCGRLPVTPARGCPLTSEALAGHAERVSLKVLRAWVLECARYKLLTFAVCLGRATADDVYASVEVPDCLDPRCLGMVPWPLVKAGLITRSGFIPSERRARHGSMISLWKLADRPAAEHWLEAHPESPDPRQRAGR